MLPGRPCGAPVSTLPLRAKPCSPDSSTVPPSPAVLPPRAVTRPAIVVCSVLSTVTRPPPPACRASAATRAPAAITVRRDVPAGAGPLPAARAAVVPTATSPPPPAPEADRRAPRASVVVSLPATTTVPPLLPGVRPSAARRPSITTEPPVPATSMRPVRPSTVLAWMVPPARTSVCTTPSAATALSCTTPPSAAMVPVLVTSAVTGLPSGPAGTCRTCPVTLMATRPSPYMSSVWVAAPASTTWPSFALMVPELATEGATSAASPACRTVIVPRLSMRAFALPGWSNTILPAIRLAFVMPAALTTTLCALTWAPW